MKTICIAIFTLFISTTLEAQENLSYITCKEESRFSASGLSAAFHPGRRIPVYNPFQYKESAPVDIPYTIDLTIFTNSRILTSTDDEISFWQESLKVNMKSRTMISAGLFVPTIVTGYMMRSSNGSPNDALLAVHKISSLSNIILLDATVFKKRKFGHLSLLESVAAITMNVGFVTTIATGGMQSVGKPMPQWVNTSHSITPWITMISSGFLLYLLNK